MGCMRLYDNSEITLLSATSEEPSSRSNLESFVSMSDCLGVFALTAKDQPLLGGFVRPAVAFITAFAVVVAYHDSGHYNQ